MKKEILADKQTVWLMHDEKEPEPILASGHVTDVVRRETLSGPFVEKKIKSTGDSKSRPEKWQKQIEDAMKIANAVHDLANPAYNVPKTIILHDRVFEQFAPGVRLCDLPRDFVSKNSDWFMPALGHFINDMSQMRPVKQSEYVCRVENLRGDDVEKLAELLSEMPEIITSRDAKTIINTYRYMAELPENKTLVFGHTDLNSENIIVDVDARKVSIIDFEIVGYRSQMAMMYNARHANSPELWDFINKLPRTKNTQLRWEYDMQKRELFHLMYRVISITKGYKYWRDEVHKSDEKMVADRAADLSNVVSQMRYRMGRIRAKSRTQTNAAKVSTLVPKSHYDR